MQTMCQGIQGAPRRAGAGILDLQAGDLVLFTSWLQHHVPVHQGGGQRISISFNIRGDVSVHKGPLRLLTEEIGGFASWIPSPWRQKQLFDNPMLRVSSRVSASVSSLVEKLLLNHQSATWLPLPPELAALMDTDGIVELWRCLASGLHRKLTGATSDIAALPSGSALLRLPRDFVQTDRSLLLSSLDIAASGVHLLSGSLQLWLYD